MAAALLALQLGHDAATPTFWRQGSLVTADALPLFMRLLRPRIVFVTRSKMSLRPNTEKIN
jgi:hypothetical protein